MSQWHKIVELHRILSQSRSYRSKQELSYVLQISGPTFDRLVRELRQEFGAPLSYRKKYNGYKYEINEGESFELPGLWFTTNELNALLCLEALVGSFQEGFLDDTFTAFRERILKLLKSRNAGLADWKGRFKTYRLPIDRQILCILRLSPRLFFTAEK